MVQFGDLHQKENVLRLNIPHNVDGHGLVGTRDCVASECRSLHLYIASSDETLLRYMASRRNWQRRISKGRKIIREGWLLKRKLL